MAASFTCFCRHAKSKSEGLWSPPTGFRTFVAGSDSLQGGPERSLYGAGKVKPNLPWLPQNAEDIRLMDHLLRKAAGTERN